MLVLGLRLKSQAQHSWFGQDVENLLLSSQLSQSGELYVSTLYLYHLHSGDIVIPAEITFLPSLHSFQSVPLARSLVVKMMTLSVPPGFGGHSYLRGSLTAQEALDLGQSLHH